MASMMYYDSNSRIYIETLTTSWIIAKAFQRDLVSFLGNPYNGCFITSLSAVCVLVTSSATE